MTQFIKSVLRLSIILILPFLTAAQSTYLPIGSKYDHFLDRMGIIMQDNPDMNIYTVKPLSRKVAVDATRMADSLSRFYPYDYTYHLSRVDQYMANDLYMNNSEWIPENQDTFKSKRPIWHTIYTSPSNFFKVNVKDFFMVIDPVLQLNFSSQTGNNETVFLNSKGLTLRGLIAKHLGFSSTIIDNQERGPDYFQQRVTSSGYPAVPGAGYYKPFKTTAFDYFDARGYIVFDFLKYFNAQFGYDKNFYGNGYRSLFLSDYPASNLFLKIDMRIWKLNYQLLYSELINQHQLGDYQYPKKYGVFHHLSFNATRWLNLGIFGNIMFSRPDHFEFSYLNPLIFLVPAQQENGSPDKTTMGLDFKANIAHVLQFYGQLLFNEFNLHEILNWSQGWWGNKQGLQLGLKYINALDIKNLDLQFETNMVRPYTYSHDDTVSNYSNYNQPMAHPLGSNFFEFITIAGYQPSPRLNIQAKLIYYKQGLDSGGINYGNNIFENYNTRPSDYGFFVGTGLLSKCVNASGLISYELLNNFYIDLSAQYRTFRTEYPTGAITQSSMMYTFGIRLNAVRRQYDY